MKFTQISTLALAAMMAFSSCSKEEVMNPGEADLLPGEARIVLDLGRKGATTYSTKLAETAIKNGGVKLFYNDGGVNDGKEITMTGVSVSTDGKVVATVPADVAATKAKTIMYVYLNAASVADGAGTTAKDKHAAGTVATEINRDLSNGAPAGLSTDVTLAPGTITVTAPKAKRAIARVGATNMSTETSIAGFKIAFDGVNLTKGAIYDGSVTDGALEALEAYPLKKSGLDKDSATTSENETVAYMYPSTTVTATVTSPDGLEKKVSFAPKANMNYTIKINPKKPATDSGKIDFTVSIDEWVNADDNLEADFNNDLLSVDFVTLDAAVFGKATAEDAQITLDALKAVSEQSIELLNAIATADGNTLAEITKIEVDASAYTAGKPVYAKVVVDGTAIKVSQALNLSGVNSPDIKVIVTGKSDGKPVNGYFKIRVGKVSQDYVDAMNEATVEMDGKKWLMFDQKSEIGWCYDQALAIKAAGGFTEETIKNNHNLFMLTDYPVTPATPCPLGYKKPTLADYISLMDTHKVGAALEPKWVPAVGDEKVFANTRALRNVWNDGVENGRGYYTLTDGAKVMHIISSKGYQTSTPIDGSLGDTAAAGKYYAFAPWSNGITYSEMDGSISNTNASLRCIVDPTYVDAGL